MDDNCGKLYDRLSRILGRFKKLKLDQKLSFYYELESDDYLIVRNSYIYKVVDGSQLESELAGMVNKFQTIEDVGEKFLGDVKTVNDDYFITNLSFYFTVQGLEG